MGMVCLSLDNKGEKNKWNLGQEVTHQHPIPEAGAGPSAQENMKRERWSKQRLKMKQTQLQGSVEGKTQAPTLHRGIQTQSQRDRSITAPVTLPQPHGW